MTEHAMTSTAVAERPSHDHVVPVRIYLAVFGSLLALTGLTVAAAFVDLGPFNTLVALVIATIKMLLVVLFFMHVRYSSELTWAAIGAGVFFLALLLLMTLSDYVTRGPGWLHYG